MERRSYSASKKAPKHIVCHDLKEVWFRGNAITGMAIPVIMRNLALDYKAKMYDTKKFNDLFNLYSN